MRWRAAGAAACARRRCCHGTGAPGWERHGWQRSSLARGGWAAVLADAMGRTLCVHAGEVDSPQILHRAKLQAALWVAEGSCPW